MSPRARLALTTTLCLGFFLACDGAGRNAGAPEAPARALGSSGARLEIEPADVPELVGDYLRQGPPYRVPHVVPAELPTTLTGLTPGERKHAFLETVLPLVLVENQRITRERAELLRLLARTHLEESERRWLASLMTRYGLDVPANAGPELLATMLLRRVDEIPVSLVLAQAALESGWGTSRAAREGNALFGQYAYAPGRDGQAPAYQLKPFASLQDCMNDYMRNLNTNHAYAEFRALRLAQRRSGREIDAFALAETLMRYSSRGEAYTEHVHQMMRMNDLTRYDSASLCPVEETVITRITSANEPSRRVLLAAVK